MRQLALQDDRPLLLEGPAAAAFNTGDDLNARWSVSAHTIARMTTRIGFHCHVDHWRDVRVRCHDIRRSWDPAGKQCGGAATLTDERPVSRPNSAVDHALFESS